MLFLAVLRGSFLVPVDDDVDGGVMAGGGLAGGARTSILTPLVGRRRNKRSDKEGLVFIKRCYKLRQEI